MIWSTQDEHKSESFSQNSSFLNKQKGGHVLNYAEITISGH